MLPPVSVYIVKPNPHLQSPLSDNSTMAPPANSVAARALAPSGSVPSDNSSSTASSNVNDDLHFTEPYPPPPTFQGRLASDYYKARELHERHICNPVPYSAVASLLKKHTSPFIKHGMRFFVEEHIRGMQEAHVKMLQENPDGQGLIPSSYKAAIKVMSTLSNPVNEHTKTHLFELSHVVCRLCYDKEYEGKSLSQSINKLSNNPGNFASHWKTKHKDIVGKGGVNIPKILEDLRCRDLANSGQSQLINDALSINGSIRSSHSGLVHRQSHLDRFYSVNPTIEETSENVRVAVYQCLVDRNLPMTLCEQPVFRNLCIAMSNAGANGAKKEQLLVSYRSVMNTMASQVLQSKFVIARIVCLARFYYTMATRNATAFITIMNDLCDAQRYEILGTTISFIDPITCKLHIFPTTLMKTMAKKAEDVSQVAHRSLYKYLIHSDDLYAPMNDTTSSALHAGRLISDTQRTSYCLMHQGELITKHALGIVERKKNGVVVDSFYQAENIRNKFYTYIAYLRSKKSKKRWNLYLQYVKDKHNCEAIVIPLPNMTRVGGYHTMYECCLRSYHVLHSFQANVHKLLDKETANKLCDLFPTHFEWLQMAEIYAISLPIKKFAIAVQQNLIGYTACAVVKMALALHTLHSFRNRKKLHSNGDEEEDSDSGSSEDESIDEIPNSSSTDKGDNSQTVAVINLPDSTHNHSLYWEPSTAISNLPQISLLYRNPDDIASETIGRTGEADEVNMPEDDPNLKEGDSRTMLSQASCELIDRFVDEGIHYFTYKDTDRWLSTVCHPFIAGHGLDWLCNQLHFISEKEHNTLCWNHLLDEMMKYFHFTEMNVDSDFSKKLGEEDSEETTTKSMSVNTSKSVTQEAEKANEKAATEAEKAALAALASSGMLIKGSSSSTKKKRKKKKSKKNPTDSSPISTANRVRAANVKLHSDVIEEINEYKDLVRTLPIATLLKLYGTEDYYTFFPEQSKEYSRKSNDGRKEAKSRAIAKYSHERAMISVALENQSIPYLMDYFDPLSFWGKYRDQFPKIYIVACVVLAKPPSNAEQERMFSRVSWFEDCLRTRTLPENFENRCLESLNRSNIFHANRDITVCLKSLEEMKPETDGVSPHKTVLTRMKNQLHNIFGNKLSTLQNYAKHLHSVTYDKDFPIPKPSGLVRNKSCEPHTEVYRTELNELGDITDLRKDYLSKTYGKKSEYMVFDDTIDISDANVYNEEAGEVSVVEELDNDLEEQRRMFEEFFEQNETTQDSTEEQSTESSDVVDSGTNVETANLIDDHETSGKSTTNIAASPTGVSHQPVVPPSQTKRLTTRNQEKRKGTTQHNSSSKKSKPNT